MEVLDGATIFWLLVLGMLVGGTVKLAMWGTTIPLVSNLIAGMAATLIIGGLIVSLQLPGGLLFSFLGSLALLFVLNVFNMERKQAH